MTSSFVPPVNLQSSLTVFTTPFQTASRRRTSSLVQSKSPSRCSVIVGQISGKSTGHGIDNSTGNGTGNGIAAGIGTVPIHLMACDMDGTMLNSNVGISQRNIITTKRLIDETDVIFVPATGKSRSGAIRAMAELGEHLITKYPSGCPGVFLQGLIVFDEDGRVVYENKCEDELARAVVEVGEELGLSLIAYSRDSILCTKADEFTNLLPSYHEPQPEEVMNWDAVIGGQPLNKFIYMAEPSRIDEIRPFVAERIGNRGHLTQAQGNMLEVLPPNASKGFGVTQLLNSLGVRAENVLAIGDAENDLELLDMVGFSCAVSNALPSVKAAAIYTDLPSNDDDGVAAAIERFILSDIRAAV